MNITGMSLTALRNELRRLQEAISDAHRDAMNDKEVGKAHLLYRETLAAAEKKRLGTMPQDFTEAYNRLQEMEKAKLAKAKTAIPEVVAKFIQEMHVGVDWGPHGLKPVWWSESFRHVIATVGGFRAGCGTGQTKYYVTKHALLDMTSRNKDLCRNEGYDVYLAARVGDVFAGKLKDIKGKWIALAAEREAKTYE